MFEPFPLLIRPLSLLITLISCLALAPSAWAAPAQDRLFTPVPKLSQMVNPKPLEADLELPMPCGGKLVLRHVCVPADGYFDDLWIDLGCEDCGRKYIGFMEGRRREALSGPFALRDLPTAWYLQLAALAETGDGRCPNLKNKRSKGYYFLIGKYEISNFQWKAVMNGECPGSERPFTADDPRPKTGISWFEAVDFTRRYTEWLLKNAPSSLPRFFGRRFGYLRLPTETEWEYAARGGHLVSESQMNQEDFFPLNGRPLRDYAVFSETEGAKLPENLAWIGSKRPNPLGLFDMAGNAAEMILDPFRFSVGSRLHGTAGGFIVKGGSYRKSRAEIMPGRREELPLFLYDGAFRSTDLGFRVVLSAIVTPENRREALEKEWAARGGIDKKPKEPFQPREGSQQNEELLAQQKAETVKGIIRNAILISELLSNYAVKRNNELDELSRLKKIRTENRSQSMIAVLDEGIAGTLDTVRMCNLSIDVLMRSYLNRIRQSRGYAVDLLESQMDLVSEELSNGKSFFSQGMRRRMVIFKRHLALHTDEPRDLNQEALLKDIKFK